VSDLQKELRGKSKEEALHIGILHHLMYSTIEEDKTQKIALIRLFDYNHKQQERGKENSRPQT
jgi:hypothetical protein